MKIQLLHNLKNYQQCKQKQVGINVSVVDPDPHGSGTFAWIQIRNSENSKLDPDPE